MAIANIVINVQDLDRSVDFYRRHLGAEVVKRTGSHCVLDLVTATIELRESGDLAENPWEPDDLAHGFRHLGFKVADVAGIARGLAADGVELRIPPVEVDPVGIKVCFFLDPDGVSLEIVERHLRYHRVVDPAAVAAEHAEPTPRRPRFDHVGVSVADKERTIARWQDLGFTHTGWISLAPHVELELDFLRAGRTIVELLSPKGAGRPGIVDPAARGLGVIELDADPAPPAETPGTTLADGRRVFLDPDGLPLGRVGG